MPDAQYADQSTGWGTSQPTSQALPQSTQGSYAQPGPGSTSGGYQQQGMHPMHNVAGNTPPAYAPMHAPGYSTGAYAPYPGALPPARGPPGYEQQHAYSNHAMPYGAPPGMGMGMGMPPFQQPMGPSFMSNPFSMFNTVANMGVLLNCISNKRKFKMLWIITRSVQI